MMRNTTAQRVYPPNVPYIIHPSFKHAIQQPMFLGCMIPVMFDPTVAPILYAVRSALPAQECIFPGCWLREAALESMSAPLYV